MSKPLFLAAALLAAVPATANAATSDQQVWSVWSATAKLSPKWRLQDELTFRFSDNRHGLYEIENNLLAGYKLTDKVTLWAGYTFNPLFNRGEQTDTENRAREQITIDNFATLGRAKLSARLRFEQRWRDHVSGTGLRLRPYAKASLPLGAKSKTALVLWHESFVNLNTTGFQKARGYDRMRNFVGINTPLSKAVTIEAGYLNQYGFVRGGPNTSDNVLSVSLGANF